MLALSYLVRPSVLPFLDLLDPSFLLHQLGSPLIHFPITVAHSSYPSQQHSLLSSLWIIRSKINTTAPFHRLISKDVLLSVELGSGVRFIMCADSCDWFESFVTIEVYYG